MMEVESAPVYWCKWIFTLCQSGVDYLHVHFDFWPVGSCKHLLPDKSDLFKTGCDFIIVQLQSLVLEIVLRRCKNVDTKAEQFSHTNILKYDGLTAVV